jgi:hypothetical protein
MFGAFFDLPQGIVFAHVEDEAQPQGESYVLPKDIVDNLENNRRKVIISDYNSRDFTLPLLSFIYFNYGKTSAVELLYADRFEY